MKFKNITKCVLFLLIISIVFKTNVFAATEETAFSLCESSVLKIFRLAGYAIVLVKILVPIIIIIIGSIDLGKVLISGENDKISEVVNKFVKRFIAAAIIFFVPTLVSYALSYVKGTESVLSDFNVCHECLLSPLSDDCSTYIQNIKEGE